MKRFEAMGCVALAVALDNVERGAPVERTRMYAGALDQLDQEVSPLLVKQHIHNVLAGTTVPPEQRASAEECIISDESTRRSQANYLGFEILAGNGVRPASKDKLVSTWEVDHTQLYEHQHLQWPPLRSEYPEIIFCGMLLRETEAAIYLHAVFGPPEKSNVEAWVLPDKSVRRRLLEFVDINPTVDRVVQGSFGDDGEFNGKSPWAIHRPNTITGSSKIVMRITYFDSSPSEIRCLDAMEYMSSIGWSERDWAKVDLSEFDGIPRVPMVFVWCELCANFVGNAFSPWHYAPFQMALLSAFGKFRRRDGKHLFDRQEDSEIDSMEEQDMETELEEAQDDMLEDSDSD